MTQEKDTEALTIRVTAAQMARVAEQAIEQIKVIVQICREQEKNLREVFGQCTHDMFPRLQSDRYITDLEELIHEFQRKAWRCVIQTLNVRPVMSLKAREELERQLEDGDFPPFTEKNVLQTLQKILDDVPNMVDQAVQEVYDMLMSCGSNTKYKTNDAFIFDDTDKIIFGWALRAPPYGGGLWVNELYVPRLDALGRAFYLIDPQIKGKLDDSVSQRIQRALSEHKTELKTHYFHFKFFKKGSMHIRFLRKDLLQELKRRCGELHLKRADR